MKSPLPQKLQAGVTMVLLLFILAVGLFVIGTGSREIAGYRVYTVTSGSMEPEIPTGSLIVTKRLGEYRPGDIVTFQLPSNYRTIVTHRIIEETILYDQTAFRTQGDANSTSDREVVPSKNILGKHIFAVPYIGFIIEFARTPLGVMLLIVVPGTIILWEESKNIYSIVRAWQKDRKKKV